MRSFSRSDWILVGESIPHDMLKRKYRLKKKKGNAEENTKPSSDLIFIIFKDC